MSIFSSIVDIFTSGATTGISGVVSGLLGGVVTTVANYKMKKLELESKKDDNIHELALKDKELNLLKAEAEAGIQIAREKTSGRIEELQFEAYKESQTSMDKPLFYQEYMQYLVKSSETAHWSYRWLIVLAIFLITISFAFVDVTKHITRPGLTWYIMGLATYITVMAYEISTKAGMVMSGKEAYELLALSYHTILYLAVTAFSWWFCDRQISKFIAKRLGWDK